MSDKENDRIELDANPFAIEVANNSNSATELVETENNSIEIYNNASNAISTVVNNNMLVNNQHASSTNISFEGCNGITFGNILNFGTLAHHPQTITTVAELPIDMEESIAYRKTPTIKAMMESTQRLNDKYLDIFCAKLGHKYQAISTYLKIDEVDIKQAVEDHKLYGFSEVSVDSVNMHHLHDNNHYWHCHTGSFSNSKQIFSTSQPIRHCRMANEILMEKPL